MSHEQHKWGFPKFWKSSKHNGTAAEGGRTQDRDISRSTPRPQEKNRFHLRKSSSQSSLFQTKRNSQPTAKTVTDDQSNDPEWVPFHRSSSPRLMSHAHLVTEMKGRLTLTSPVVEDWKMAKDQSMLGNVRTFDQQMSPEKMRLLENKRMLGNGASFDQQISPEKMCLFENQRMRGNYRTLGNQQSFQNGQNLACETGEHWSCQKFDNATVSPKVGDITCRNGQQMTVSRRLFDEKTRVRQECPRSCGHVLMSTFVHGADGQNGALQQWKEERNGTSRNMCKPPVNGIAACRMDTPEKEGIRENQSLSTDVLHSTPRKDKQEITRKSQDQAISERFRMTGCPARTTDQLETNGVVIGHCPPQQGMMETINYSQVDHASGQHLDRSNKLLLIDHCYKGEPVTGNERGPLPSEQGKLPVMSSGFSQSPFQNTKKQIGDNKTEIDYRSSGPNQCHPDGADCPLPRQMVEVVTHGDVRGDCGRGIVHENTMTGSSVECGTHKMDIYGRSRGLLPRGMQAKTVDRQRASEETQDHGNHQRYKDRSSQMIETYQKSGPEKNSARFGTERQSYGNGMSPSSQGAQFSEGMPTNEQYTRPVLSYHKSTQNQGTSNIYNEQVRIEDSVRLTNFKQQAMPGYKQAVLATNKSHVPQMQPGYKPLEAKYRSPQETCTISTTSQDSGFEQRMQNYLVDSQNQSQMSSILETSVSTPPVFISGDSGDLKENHYSHHQRRPVETGTCHMVRMPLQVNSDWKHHKNQDVTDSSSEGSDSDGSSDLFVPKSQSHYDLTKSYKTRTTTNASLRAKSHNQVWPRLNDLSASDGEQQSMAKSSLVLLHSSEFISAVNMAEGGQHHEAHRKHHHHRQGNTTAKQEQIRKFKSAENVISARPAKRKSVLRLTEGDRGGRTRCHKDMDLQGDVSFDVTMATDMSAFGGCQPADRLRLAASKGQMDKVKELVLAGTSFQPDKEGRTAIHYAAVNGYAEIVSLLATEGCDIDSQDNLGYTALHRAAAQGHLEVIKVLLGEGCAIDRQDEHGNAALHEAAWNGYSQTLQLMVKHQANVHVYNKAGFSALHLAAQNGHNQSARVLLYANCNADQKNNYGDTSLHTAARYGHAGVTRILVSARCSISEQNKNGDTALHICAALKRRKIAKLLCDNVVDTSLRNKQNETAVDVARRKEYAEIILIITSQPKASKKIRAARKKAAKNLQTGLTVNLPEDKEKKEKKGFFFRKKSSRAAKEKEKEAKEAMVAPSDTSTSYYTSDTKGAHSQHQMTLPQQQARGTSTTVPPVHGLLSNYVPKTGVQYYRDLAGNIKQGPIGYTAVCVCAPQMKRMEKKMECDHNNMYDHIDASHRTLAQRIDTLDRRCAQQVHAIDRLTKERLDQERRNFDERIRTSARRERVETEKQIALCRVNMRTDLQTWMDSQLTTGQGGSRIMDNRHALYGRNPNCRAFQRGDVLNQSFDRRSFEHDCDQASTPLPGKLYRSKSDDTLSVSSSQAGGAHRLSRRVTERCNDELLSLHIQSISAGRPQPMQMISNQKHRKHQSRDNLLGGAGDTFRDRVWSFHEDVRKPLSGRSPEGQSGDAAEFSEYSSEICVDGDGQFDCDAWYNMSKHRYARQFQEADGKVSGAPSGTSLHQKQNGGYTQSQSTAARLGDGKQCLVVNSTSSNQRKANISNERTAPAVATTTHVVQVHHSKADSSGRSNPDSGYGGKSINGLGKPPVPLKKPSLGPASFQMYSVPSCTTPSSMSRTTCSTTTSTCNTSATTCSSLVATSFNSRTSESKDRHPGYVPQLGRVSEVAPVVPEASKQRTICASGVVTQSSCLIGVNIGRATQV